MILITGATGFLGKRGCNLLEQSHRAYYKTSLSLGTDLIDFEKGIRDTVEWCIKNRKKL